jgi:acetoin utilization protein AcuB
MDVEQIMTAPVTTIGPSESVHDALERLEDQEIRHLPVVDGSRMVGIVSDRDLREFRLPLMEEMDRPQYAAELMRKPVSEAMNTEVIFVETGEPVSTAIDLMIEYAVGALPVVERDTGNLAGIVSYIDVLKALRDSA